MAEALFDDIMPDVAETLIDLFGVDGVMERFAEVTDPSTEEGLVDNSTFTDIVHTPPMQLVNTQSANPMQEGDSSIEAKMGCFVGGGNAEPKQDDYLIVGALDIPIGQRSKFRVTKVQPLISGNLVAAYRVYLDQ